MKTSIDIIIPVYFAPELTARCAESVVKTTENLDYDIEIILVDDSESRDFSKLLVNLLKVEGILDKVKVITREKNGGFIEACYTGVENREADYKVLLNSDTVVMDNWLSEMIQTAESDEKIAMVNPITNHAAVINIPMSQGSNSLLMNEFVQGIKFNNKSKIDIVTIVGFCLLIKSKYIKEYGFFDRIFDKGYGEESDLHFRYTKHGLRCVFSPNAFVYHRGEASFTDRDERTKKNLQIFLDRYSKEYFVQSPEFERTTILNTIREDIKLNQKFEYDYLFVTKTNNYFDSDYFLSCQLANLLIEKGYSCNIIVEKNVDKGDKIEDNLFNVISIDRLLKTNFNVKHIISSESTISNAVKLSVISTTFENLSIIDGNENTVSEFDFEKNTYVKTNSIKIPELISLEFINSKLKKTEKNTLIILYDSQSNLEEIRLAKSVMKDYDQTFTIFDENGLKPLIEHSLLANDFAESELLRVVNSAKVVIDLRVNKSFSNIHLAFAINNCHIFSNTLLTERISQNLDYTKYLHSLNELSKDFPENNDFKFIDYSPRKVLKTINLENLNSEINTAKLRSLFKKYYQDSHSPVKVKLKILSNTQNQNINRLRYRFVDKILNLLSRIPYFYKSLEFLVKVVKKLKRIIYE